MPGLQSSLGIDLHQGDEDPAEARLVAAFHDLINGKIKPAAAATVVDDIISGECRQGAARYEAAAEDEKEAVNSSGIRGWQKYLYVDLIATAAMMIPSEDTAQDSLVMLVQELNALPKHTVPCVLPDGSMCWKELWNITPEEDYDGFRQWLWEIIEGGAKPFNKDYDTKYYVNLSSFIARLLASGTAAMLGSCALLDPFARRSLVSARSEDPAKYAYRVAAAAQWILHAGEGIREMCVKNVMAGKRWTPGLWDGLKLKFDAVARDGRFTEEGCWWAAQARDRMEELEKDELVSKVGVVEVFNFQGPAVW